MRTHLSERAVRAALPRADDYQIFDEVVIGLALVVYPSGRRSFAVSYRVAGRPRRIVIGRWPDWSVVAARDRARAIKRDAAAGLDPAAARAAALRSWTIEDLAGVYRSVHLPRLAERNARDQEAMLSQLVLPRIGRLQVDQVTRADVDALLRWVADGRGRSTWVRANRCGEMVRVMFGLAVARQIRPDNPASGFLRRPEGERSVFLDGAQLGRLGDALDGARDQTAAAAVRLLLLTGARPGEVVRARFEDFNLAHLIWSKPAATTKQRRIHRAPISADAAAIVRLRRQALGADCRWLFPAACRKRPIRSLRRFWEVMRLEADLPGVRLNDIRHTFASLLISGGSSLEMIGRLLGHSQTRTTQRYAHLMDGPLRGGVDAVASAVRYRLRSVDG